MERTRGTSMETDRGQGAYCAPETLRANSHSEREVRRRGWKPMGHKEGPVPKATRTKNVEQWREK